ncbi:hypothetical protein AJ88_14245 [Mesorhizobium amorphae CCBAU 01583]|nr:hypothetical protein AJ88_14245 [Mesorhizobium amorphae CCBAU 01583]
MPAHKIIGAVLMTAALAGCSQTEGQQRAATGALVSGSATKLERRREEMCRYRDRDGFFYTASCDNRPLLQRLY